MKEISCEVCPRIADLLHWEKHVACCLTGLGPCHSWERLRSNLVQQSSEHASAKKEAPDSFGSIDVPRECLSACLYEWGKPICTTCPKLDSPGAHLPWELCIRGRIHIFLVTFSWCNQETELSSCSSLTHAQDWFQLPQLMKQEVASQKPQTWSKVSGFFHSWQHFQSSRDTLWSHLSAELCCFQCHLLHHIRELLWLQR